MIYKFIGEKNYPPFDFIVENKATGFNVDITNAICKSLNIQHDINLKEWAKLIDDTKTDNGYIYQGIFKSQERSKYLHFSNSYLTVSHSFLVDKSKNSLENKQLNEMIVGVQRDSVTHDFLKEKRNQVVLRELRLFNNHTEILKELFKGNLDAIAGNRMTILYLVNKYFKDKELITVGNPIEMSSLCYAGSHNSKEMMDKINLGLKIIKENGIYDLIYQKWFGAIISKFNDYFVDNVDTAVIYIDSLGKIVRINKVANELLNNYDLIGKNIFSFGINSILPIGTIRKVMDGHEESIFDNVKCEINNSIAYLSYCATPVHDSLGNVNGAVISIKNETKDIIANKKLVNYDKLKSLSRIVGGVAHEIRNPLTSIKNYIDLLPRLYDDPEFRLSIIKNLPQQIEIIDELVNELLQYTKPQKPCMEVLDCKNIIDITIRLTKFNKNLNIINNVPENVFVLVDKKYLMQVITNILINSVDASNDGDNIVINGYLNKNKDYYNIEILDNGIGIEKEKLDYVFEPFFTDKTSGTGLGLYICHQLMRENNGSIDIESSISKGTKVTLSVIKYKGELNGKYIDC
ncbi:transporter substrate-binding domain-containing protein [Neofamilia massiliensis]|uniref:transporter substrate-binding domain-containing protein n=1 Tax=Neofamilia massiliensis TaxID=1673724 RepID=UPI0006BB8FBC|nr:transporter substrate-binding domain-containing protein [Neofamilia massiliensis]